MSTNPEWKDVDGWEGCYQVSSAGDVRSLTRITERSDGVVVTFRGKVIKKIPAIHGGAVFLQDFKSGRRIRTSVAKIFYEAFVGRVPDGEIAICTSKSGNICRETVITGRRSDATWSALDSGRMKRGEASAFCKINKGTARKIFQHRKDTGDSYEKIGVLFGVSATTAYRICSGLIWRRDTV